MESKPDTIQVSADHLEEIHASHADLMVMVKGSSVFSSNEAMKKAKEVSQLVEALTTFGLSPGEIQLEGIFAETSNDTFLKSSSATYHLKSNCKKLEQLADLLAIVTSQRNTTLEYIDWKYDDDTTHQRILEQAIEKAKIKAQKVSAALGVSLLGIYSFHEDNLSEGEIRVEYGRAPQKTRASGASTSMNLGMDIHHNKVIRINVNIEYRVSEFEQNVS